MVYIGVPKIREDSVMNDHFPNQLATCGVYPIFRHYLSDIHCHVHCYGHWHLSGPLPCVALMRCPDADPRLCRNRETVVSTRRSNMVLQNRAATLPRIAVIIT